MKKIVIILTIFVLLFPIKALALETVYIKDIEVVDTTGSAESSSHTYNVRDINLELKFKDKNDSVKYKIIIKNDDMEDFYLSELVDNTTSEYITYTYDVGESNVFKHGEEKTIYLTATYTKEVDSSLLDGSGMYVENNNSKLSVKLQSINVPDTYKSISIVGITSISLLIIIGVALIIKDRRAEGLMVLLGILLVPSVTNALVDIKLNINANVRVIPGEDKICIIKVENRTVLDEEYISYDPTLDMSEYYFVPRKIMECRKLPTDEEEDACVMAARFDTDYDACMDSGTDEDVCYEEYMNKVSSGKPLETYYGCYYEKLKEAPTNAS